MSFQSISYVNGRIHLSVALVATALLFVSSHSALALCVNGGIGAVTAAESPVNSTQTIGNNAQCSVEEGARITTTAGGALGISSGNMNTVTNNGAISTTGATADGITSNDSGTITNNGTISTTGDQSDGIQVDDDSALTNAGQISTEGNTSRGLRADDNNTIANSGSISTSGDFSDGITASDSNRIVNSGSVSTTGAIAEGIQVEDNNVLINNGSVTTTGVNSEAIQVVNNNTVINSGVVYSAQSDAVEFTGTGNTLDLLPGSTVFGGLNFAAGNTLTVRPGLSVAFTFNNQMPATINAFGAPIAQSGNQIAIVDTTAMGQAGNVMLNITNGISNAVYSGLGNDSGTMSNSAGGMTPAMRLGASMKLGTLMNRQSDRAHSHSTSNYRSSRLWVRAFAGHRNEEATSTTSAATHSYAGGITGMDRWISRSIQVGGFAGGTSGKVKVPLSQEVTDETFFGGAYANFTDGASFLRVLLTAGTSHHDSSRRVANNTASGGVQFADASFDSYFVSPELAAGTTWHLGWFALEPSVRLRYAHLSLDGYSETGAAGNFTVSDRDVSSWQGRAQLAFPIVNATGMISPRLGIEASTSNHGTVQGTLLGQSVSFAPGDDTSNVTGFVGATTSSKLGQTATAFLDYEIHADGDGFARAEAHASIKISF